MSADPRELAAVRRELLLNYGDVLDDLEPGNGINIADVALVHVDEDMTRLVEAAAAQLDRFDITEADVFGGAVLLHFAGLESLPNTHLVTGHANGAHHGIVTARGAPFAEATGRYVVPAVQRVEWGRSTAEEGEPYAATRLIAAALLLLGQKIATQSSVEAARATRRGLARERRTSPPIRVITLRQPSSTGTRAEGREYRSRWIVRGHWRRQWHAARQEHRPTWIAAHVKGPEDAPLLTGEKVYAWRQ